MLIVAAGLALEPELATGTGPEAGQARAEGDGQRFARHVGQGEDLAGGAVDDDGGN